jgi:two-component system, cell cycle response regulator DivK
MKQANDLIGKVLIIDDDPTNILALTAVLRSKGYPVVSATHARGGLRTLSDDGTIRIVLLDMMMPELDGYELIPMIREQHGDTIPVIAVTAQAMKGDREKCLAAGANDYVSKPIDVDRLFGLLEHYIK